jgi:TPR repeat protein
VDSRDEVRASTLWDRACKAGDGAGCYGLGTQYNLGTGGMAKDEAHAEALFAQATPLLDRACAVDCADACAARAWTLHTGQGRGEDNQAAFAGMTRACELGSGEGCFLLSQMLTFGYGTAANPATAAGAARKACELHDALGCNAVAYGLERAHHPEEGKPFHQQACKLGLKESCAKLTGAAPSHGE